MLNAIKALLVGAREVPVIQSVQSSLPAGPAGYFMPGSAAQLLNTSSRKQCLQQLWENSALPKDLYERFYLQPLRQLVELMQVLPASQQGEFAREGGLADVTLQTTTFAVRLAKGHMLPPGAAPEDQSAQNILWNAVVFYAALWHYLPLLSQVEGELQSGRAWLPGLTVPAGPYRFRFRGNVPEPALVTSQSALIACRLMPAEAISWLSTLPAAAEAVMLIASRQPGSLPVIDDIVREAVRLARGEGLIIAAPSVAMPHVLPVPVDTLIPRQSTAASELAPDTGITDVGLQRAVTSVPATQSSSTKSHHSAGVSGPGDVLLSSALDTPVNDKPLAERLVTPEPVVGAEEDMQTLLSLMDVSVAAPANQQVRVPLQNGNPVPESDLMPVQITPTVTEDYADLSDQRQEPGVAPQFTEAVSVTSPQCQPQITGKQGDVGVSTGSGLTSGGHSGETFWQWLSEGLVSGEIPVNTPEARIHLVAGFVFITVPGIFYLYLKQSGLEGGPREALQEDFERLEKHRRVKGKRFYFAHLYESSDRTGPFKRTKGYLIKASLLYRGKGVSADSPVLVIP
uniref:TraI domain-containing protein n=1 Tax=Scandinavium goeteborgense TaxID=1851514 RepID=UPI00135B2B2D|nr:TraI domain-containing protein [Scandinavium goeteborgense]